VAPSIPSWAYISRGGCTRSSLAWFGWRYRTLIFLGSDQLIKLATVNPAKYVRIAGITADHGLLRTVPERRGWSSGDEGFIDLQPDGNSFDLMAGLIKSKS